MINPSARSRFDRRAADYRRRMGRGPLGRLRRRERALVRSLLGVERGETVLDAGCGAGFDAAWLQEAGAVVLGVDASPEMVRAAQAAGIDAREGDICDLALGRSFDKAICLGALEFCAPPDRALQSIARHLHPGATLVVLYPCRSLWGRSYAAYHRAHGVPVRLYADGSMERLVRGAGFVVDVDVRATPISRVLAARLGEGT